MNAKGTEFDSVFNAHERSVLTTAWEEEGPEGSFFKGRHGYTHYVVDKGAAGNDSSRGTIVLSHGIGKSSHMYNSLAKNLVDSGYNVVRYDFWGHGYSKYDGASLWVPFTPDMLVDQLEDLLDVVMDKNSDENFIAFVGHSTGALVGIHSAHRWGSSNVKESKYRVPPNMILIAPALWAKKPFLANLVDKMPRIFAWLMSKLPRLNFLISDSYTEAGEIAFATEPRTKEIIYLDEKKNATERDARLFGSVKGTEKHPFLVPAINSVNWGMLKGDLYEGHRETMAKVLEGQRKGVPKMRILHLWGELDATVPFEPNIDTARKWEKDNGDSYCVQTLERIGHEAVFENSGLLGESIMSWLKDQ